MKFFLLSRVHYLFIFNGALLKEIRPHDVAIAKHHDDKTDESIDNSENKAYGSCPNNE